MNDLEQEQEQVLARARAALSPSAEDAQRVFDATSRALSGASPLAAIERSRAGAVGRALRRGAAAGRAGKLLVAVAFAGLAGVYGYRAGFAAGRAASTPAAQPAQRERPPYDPRTPPLTRDAAALAPGEPRSSVVTRESTSVRVKKGVAAPAPSTQAPASPDAPALSLPEELEVLKRVERALRAREPGLALELLDDLEQRQPATALAEERSAASVAARCALGLGSRTSLVEAFLRAHPESVYVARVREACEPP